MVEEKKKVARSESVRMLRVLYLSTQRIERNNHKLQLMTWRLGQVIEKGSKRVRPI